jgi:hypothetical protein
LLWGCAELLGVDDVVYRGGDGAVEAMTDATDAATIDAPSSCDGPCPPTMVVTQNGLLPTLATDGTNVFFRTQGTVWSCPTTGCASPTSLSATSTTGLEVVAGSTNLALWTDGTKVYGCAPGACGIPKTYVDFASRPVTGLAASTLSSFVLASGGDGSILSVHRISLDASNDTTVFSGSPGGGAPGPVAAEPNASHVYWSQVGTPTLFDCAQTSCTQPDHTVNSSGGSPMALLAISKALFVVTSSGISIAPTPISTTQSFTSGSIAGATTTTSSTARIYFAEGQTIQSCSTTPPCTPTTEHAGNAAITAITADDVALYWIEGSTIMRQAL